MEFKKENNILTLYFEGKVDSVNAPAVENEVKDICSRETFEKLVIDMDKLEYISSSGLRILLRLAKDYKNVTLENVSNDVYDIMEMTGFTEILEVKKAFRKISVEGCSIIGKGANGTVYRINGDTIVKVYIHGSLDDIQNERTLSRKAFVKGIPTAIPYDVVRVGDKFGSVFELLNAASLLEIILKEPERTDEVIIQSVEVLKGMHATTFNPGEIPSMKQKTLGWRKNVEGYVDEDLVNRFFEMVNDVPEDNHSIHGDYHIKNIMTQNGEILLIDMDTLCTGNPVFEFAFMFNSYVGFSEYDPTEIERFFGIDLEAGKHIWKVILDTYFNGRTADEIADIENKAKVVGYMRMLRRIIRHGLYDQERYRKEFAFISEKLRETIGKVTNLYI